MKRFLIKGTAILLAVLSVGGYAANRYDIGIDGQENKCLPYTLFIIDTFQKDIGRGDMFAYSALNMNPVIDDGATVIKIAAGAAGDTVEVGDTFLKVNNTPMDNGLLRHAEYVAHKEATDLVGTTVIPQGELFAYGTEPPSFDSRYWGTVKPDQVLGKAYPIF